jgi:DNA gyrase subunit A
VVAFKVADEKRGDWQAIPLESEKGKKVQVEIRKGEVVARGGRGRELVRKDKLRPLEKELAWVKLPEEVKS